MFICTECKLTFSTFSTSCPQCTQSWSSDGTKPSRGNIVSAEENEKYNVTKSSNNFITDVMNSYSQINSNVDNERPPWPKTWMDVTKTISKRSYDPRLRVGAIIVPEDNTQILSMGYNGNAKGMPNTPESLEPGKSGFLHAELNCVIKCDFNFPKKKHMYCTHSACRSCAKIIVNAGIARFIYDELYRDSSGLDILRECGVEVLSLAEAT